MLPKLSVAYKHLKTKHSGLSRGSGTCLNPALALQWCLERWADWDSKVKSTAFTLVLSDPWASVGPAIKTGWLPSSIFQCGRKPEWDESMETGQTAFVSPPFDAVYPHHVSEWQAWLLNSVRTQLTGALWKLLPPSCHIQRWTGQHTLWLRTWGQDKVPDEARGYSVST